MNQSVYDRTLALAGVFQAARLVDMVATQGKLEADFYQASLNSIFQLEPDTVEEVYEGKNNLKLGLRTLQSLLQFDDARELMPTLRYSMSILELEKKLSSKPAMLTKIRERIQSIASQADYFSVTDPRVVENLATLYQDTLSTLTTRIKVEGNPIHLRNEQVAHQVRALLLAGIRSAHLWHHLGGSRFKLMLSFSSTSNAINELLNH